MIIPVINVYLNLPPLIKVRALIQKNAKYIYHLVGGMIPNFLRTCFSWDSIKLFSDGTLFIPLRFVLMTKTLPRKRSWTPKKGRSVWQQTPQSFWRSASELVGHDEQRHPIQPHHTTGVMKHDPPPPWPVMYSQQWSPAPSTTAHTPELRTCSHHQLESSDRYNVGFQQTSRKLFPTSFYYRWIWKTLVFW